MQIISGRSRAPLFFCTAHIAANPQFLTCHHPTATYSRPLRDCPERELVLKKRCDAVTVLDSMGSGVNISRSNYMKASPLKSLLQFSATSLTAACFYFLLPSQDLALAQGELYAVAQNPVAWGFRTIVESPGTGGGGVRKAK